MYTSIRRSWGHTALGAAAVVLVTSAYASRGRADLTPLPTTGTFDYQLNQRYAAADGVSIVSSDGDISADPTQPARGNQPLDTSRFNICYLNVLQAQPDPADKAYWLREHSDLVLKSGDEVLTDPDWPDEMLFDISTAANREALLQLELPWIEQCRAAGFQAIEPDNIDSFDRSEGSFDAVAAADFMKRFVAAAHEAGLLVGQKNVAEWAKAPEGGGDSLAKQVGFDFVIVEECKLTGECPQLVQYYGAQRVFDVEYWYDQDYTLNGITIPKHTRAHFDQACQQLDAGVRVVLRNRDVRPASQQGYMFDACVAKSSTSAPDTSGPDMPSVDGQPGSEPGGETPIGDETQSGDETEP
jgi:hypothetical protein